MLQYSDWGYSAYDNGFSQDIRWSTPCQTGQGTYGYGLRAQVVESPVGPSAFYTSSSNSRYNCGPSGA